MTATRTRIPFSTPKRTVTRPAAAAASAADDDRVLVARIADGDREALGELYRRYRGKVAGYVRRRIAVEADIDDVVQETFLRAVRDAGNYRPEQGREVRSWLCGLAAWQLRDYARNDRWPYLAAVDATREALARPGIESSEDRANRPLSAPVRAAVERLNPAEQRAVALRYLEGLNGRDAAERASSSRSAVETNAMTARRKLAWMLADHAPAATSPVQEMRPGQAIEAALTAVGYDHPAAAQEWLRQRGVRVSKSHVYNVRNRGPRPDADHDQGSTREGAGLAAQPDQSGQDRQVEHATDEHGLRALPERRRPGVKPVLRDRARAAGRHYREQHGRLPTSAELAEVARVSPRTAAKALRDLASDRRAQPDAAGRGRSIDHAERPRPALAEQAERRHRVRAVSVRSPAAHSTPPDRAGTRHHAASQDRSAGRAARHNEANADEASDANGPPHADVSIARARVTVAVLNAHRAEHDKSRVAEQARTEQLNHWHDNQLHDNHGRSRTWRASTRPGRAHNDHGEGHTR